MPTVTDRYDRTAREYLRWWAPVLAPSALGLLDRVASLAAQHLPDRSEPAPQILDLGCGTGTLSLAALRLWPTARVVGVDASSGMLTVAGEQAAALGVETPARLQLVQADAADLPLDDASVDVAVSSYVVQLVPDRAAVLRELHRVLCSGGILGIANWLGDEGGFAPDDALEDALDELGIEREPLDEGPKAGHFRSLRAAADEVRRAGFRQVQARAGVLNHRWTADDWAAYKERLKDRDVFGGLNRRERDSLQAAFRCRLAALGPDEFVDRAPTLTIVARRP